tara:strand:- start:158 stop:799 length:642 start_codon:yes stop_codon:yes gene_type:complete
MQTNSLYTKIELENLFAKDFSHPTFPQLAEIYLRENDLNRARKVCQVGLRVTPNNIEAHYISAKIELLDHNIAKAEKILKDSYSNNAFSEKIIKLLVEVRDELSRSKKETKKIIDELLNSIPDDTYANKWIHNYNQSIKKNIVKKNKEEIFSYNNIRFKVNKNLVSITFYHILKNQKYYMQATSVLDVLYDSKKIKSNLYKIEKKALAQLLNQ